jgi:hypothetical protein
MSSVWTRANAGVHQRSGVDGSSERKGTDRTLDLGGMANGDGRSRQFHADIADFHASELGCVGGDARPSANWISLVLHEEAFPTAA